VAAVLIRSSPGTLWNHDLLCVRRSSK